MYSVPTSEAYEHSMKALIARASYRSRNSMFYLARVFSLHPFIEDCVILSSTHLIWDKFGLRETGL